MSKTKRKRYTGAFKARVGLEALMGVKTVGQIARDYQVHPVQVTQWKGVIREHLPELFEPARPEGEERPGGHERKPRLGPAARMTAQQHHAGLAAELADQRFRGWRIERLDDNGHSSPMPLGFQCLHP